MNVKWEAGPEKATVFYPRKIGRAGGTRTLSVGSILPASWQVVKVTVLKLEGDECILSIKKLV